MWPTGIQVLYGESTRVCGTGTKLLRQEFVREKNIAIIIYYSTYLYSRPHYTYTIQLPYFTCAVLVLQVVPVLLVGSLYCLCMAT